MRTNARFLFVLLLVAGCGGDPVASTPPPAAPAATVTATPTPWRLSQVQQPGPWVGGYVYPTTQTRKDATNG
jgi:hypothetical protein